MRLNETPAEPLAAEPKVLRGRQNNEIPHDGIERSQVLAHKIPDPPLSGLVLVCEIAEVDRAGKRAFFPVLFHGTGNLQQRLIRSRLPGAPHSSARR